MYVGFDSKWPNRKNQHLTHKKSKCRLFAKAINKYGKDGFDWDILYQSKDRDHTLNVMEPQFIAELNSISPYGYNLTRGGDTGNRGIPMSEEQKKKISAAHRGRKFSQEHREKLRLAKLGTKQSDETRAKRRLLPSPMAGQTHTEETRRKLSASHINKHQTEETRQKIAEKISIPCTVDGVEYPSRKKAMLALRIGRATLETLIKK